MKFKIVAVDEKGKDQTVVVEANSEKDALAVARQKGFFPTSITQVSDTFGKTVPPTTTNRPPPVSQSTPDSSSHSRSGSFTYKMIQVPSSINVDEKSHKGTEAAAYLESLVNHHAREGWEFYRVDTLGVKVLPGCLRVFLGAQPVEVLYYVVTFRRLA